MIMVDKIMATSLYAKKNKVVFACGNRHVQCSRRKLRLMRQHDLGALFQKGNIYRLEDIFPPQSNGRIRVIPAFRHPHDKGVRRHPLMETYDGKVISVSCAQDGDHLLVELAPNVFGFAECENFDDKHKKVRFVPYKYNHKTKKIYGYLE